MERLETIDALTPDHHPRDLLPWLSQQDPGATVASLGERLLTMYLVPFEVAGVLLMIVMVGAAHLARQEE